MILLYARFAGQQRGSGVAPPLVFALIYLAIWTAFSVAAVVVRSTLISVGSISATDLKIGNRPLAGLPLIVSGTVLLLPISAALNGIRLR